MSRTPIYYKSLPLKAFGVYRTDFSNADEAAHHGSLRHHPTDVCCQTINSAAQLRGHLETLELVAAAFGNRVDLAYAFQRADNDQWLEGTAIDPNHLRDEPEWSEPVLRITGSDGYLICSATNGRVLDRSGDPEGAYGGIMRFNVYHVSTPYDPEEFEDFDVLYMGHWMDRGDYCGPATFEREEDIVGEGACFVAYYPRWIGDPTAPPAQVNGRVVPTPLTWEAIIPGVETD